MAEKHEIHAALAQLVKLHHDWFVGSAYVSVAFKEKNDAAISEARRILRELETAA